MAPTETLDIRFFPQNFKCLRITKTEIWTS